MILGQLPVFSRKSYLQGLEKGGNTAPIGSGPYRLVKTDSGRLSEFARDKKLLGARFALAARHVQL